MTTTAEYLDTLAAELRELVPSVHAMLGGAAPLDPIVLLSLVQTAALALHEGPNIELPEDALEAARSLLAEVRRKPGKAIFERVFDALDVHALAHLGASPSEEPEELQSRLHDIFELGFLTDVLTGARRERLVGALERVCGEVLVDPDAHAPLYETAFLLQGIAELPEEHPVAELLDTIVATTDTLAHLDDASDAEALTAMFGDARARFEAALDPVERLVRWAGQRWADLADLLAVGPVRALAASGRERPSWPAPRVVLERRDELEVALLPYDHRIRVELAGRSLPPAITVSHLGVPLVEKVGAHPHHRVWELPPEVDLAALDLVIDIDHITLAVGTVGARIAHAPPTPLRGRLPYATDASPGWTQHQLSLLARAVEPDSLALSLDFAAQAGRIELPRLRPEIGRASFIAIPADPDARGFLVHIGATGFAAGAPLGRAGASAAALARVAQWVGALIGAPDAIAPDTLDLRLDAPMDVTLEGDSWQLAAALAVISERLGVAPRVGLVASGRLGDGVGEVLAVEHVKAKRDVLATELRADQVPDLVLIADHPQDIRPELARIFGADWDARLRSSLGLAREAFARDALRAWRAWFGRRNIADASVDRDRDRALDMAERSLAAGVSGLHRVEALWVEGACRLHRGESARALATFAEVDVALAALAPGRLAAFTREELVAYRGIALVDLGRPGEAVALVRPLLEHLDAIRLSQLERVDRRYFDVRLQVAGTLARATAFAGDIDEARRILRESLDFEVPAERARTLMDLAELERRAGELSRAHALLAEARAALEDIPSAQTAAFTERFLRLYEVRAGLAHADGAPDTPDWAAWPQPAEVLEALIAGPRAALLAWTHAHILAAPDRVSTIHLMLVLTALVRATRAVEPGDRDRQAIAGELAEIVVARAGIEPDLHAIIRQVHGGDPAAAEAWLRRFPY